MFVPEPFKFPALEMSCETQEGGGDVAQLCCFLNKWTHLWNYTVCALSGVK
jgi:hypothetical protein